MVRSSCASTAWAARRSTGPRWHRSSPRAAAWWHSTWPGFGHTRGGSRSTSVQANQRLLHRFLTEVAGAPAILVGNSMGGLISILQASQRPDTVAGLVLVDPALPPALSARPDPRVFATFAAFLVPVVGRRVLSRRRNAQSAEEAAHALLRLRCADLSRVPSDIVDLHVELAGQRREYPDVDSEMLVAAQSLMWVLADRRRFAAMQRSIDVPVLLLHGDRDRLINIATARAAAAANPSWQFEVARGVGHVPQLEVPQWTSTRSSSGSSTTRTPSTSPPRPGPSSRTGGDHGAAQLARRRVPPGGERQAADACRVAAHLRGSRPIPRGIHRAPGVLPGRRPAVPPTRAADAAGPRSSGVGGRPALLAGLPPASYRDPVARGRRPAPRTRRPGPVPEARRRPTAVGELARRGPARAAVGVDHQDPSRDDRRPRRQRAHGDRPGPRP